MAGPDLYQAIGGTTTCRKLSEAFYARVARNSLLRPLFPGKTFRCAIEEFAAFLAQFLGGPPEDAQRRWWLSLRESHLRFKIGQKERDAWIGEMTKALDDVPIEEPVRSALLELFEKSSSYVVNTGPVAPAGGVHGEFAERWETQKILDAAVAAVRAGEIDRAIALAEDLPLQKLFERNRAVHANLLALMIAGAMVDYARKSLLDHPGLAHQRYSGRTLLHAASAAGNLSLVELLLRLGADPNNQDTGGHTPLYCAGNECKAGGAAVVKALVQSGANVDARDGVKHCTALHMAARRGTVEIAEALLDCGAEIDARDSLGDTPLRRSVNCGKTEVAALLISRGADRHSKGSRGLTPVLAARAGAMRQILQS